MFANIRPRPLFPKSCSILGRWRPLLSQQLGDWFLSAYHPKQLELHSLLSSKSSEKSGRRRNHVEPLRTMSRPFPLLPRQPERLRSHSFSAPTFQQLEFHGLLRTIKIINSRKVPSATNCPKSCRRTLVLSEGSRRATSGRVALQASHEHRSVFLPF